MKNLYTRILKTHEFIVRYYGFYYYSRIHEYLFMRVPAAVRQIGHVGIYVLHASSKLIIINYYYT